MRIFRQTEAEKIHHQETYTERNIKESSVGSPPPQKNKKIKRKHYQMKI